MRHANVRRLRTAQSSAVSVLDLMPSTCRRLLVQMGVSPAHQTAVAVAALVAVHEILRDPWRHGKHPCPACRLDRRHFAEDIAGAQRSRECGPHCWICTVRHPAACLLVEEEERRREQEDEPEEHCLDNEGYQPGSALRGDLLTNAIDKAGNWQSARAGRFSARDGSLLCPQDALWVSWQHSHGTCALGRVQSA